MEGIKGDLTSLGSSTAFFAIDLPVCAQTGRSIAKNAVEEPNDVRSYITHST
jgi:hypothetical protein